jgi:hypothetical protein
MCNGRKKNGEFEARGGSIEKPVEWYAAAVRIGRSSLVFALLCFFFSLSLATRNSSLPFAQQPQAQQGQPLSALNAKYVNGVAPGYWPTNGAGLTLSLSAGSSVCGNSQVAYAGGTLTMAANTTNYVYLDMTKSCAPASAASASGFPPTGVPIAVVTTSGTAIAAISDARTWFAARPSVDLGGQLYNVKAYGATGDGSTDDTAAILLAINTLTGYGSYPFGSVQLYFPTGTYLTSSSLVVLGNNAYALDFVGEAGGHSNGTGATIKSTSSAPVMIWMGTNQAKIENLDLDQNGVARFGLLITANNTVNTTLGTTVTAAGNATVTPASMANIVVGSWQNVDTGSSAEAVYVTATTANSFTPRCSAPIGVSAAGGAGSSGDVIRKVTAYGVPSVTSTSGTGSVVAFNAAPTNGGTGGMAQAGDILQNSSCYAMAIVNGISGGNITSVNTVPVGVGNGTCPAGAGQPFVDETHPGETGIQLNIASVTNDCGGPGSATCTAGFAVGNVIGSIADEAAGVTWYDSMVKGADGNANMCFGVLEDNGNTQDFLLYNTQGLNCRYGWSSSGNDQIAIYGGEWSNTYADFSTGGETMLISGVEDEPVSGHFVVGTGACCGRLTVENSAWNGSTPGDGYVMRYNGQLTLSGNYLTDHFTGSYPKIALYPGLFPNGFSNLTSSENSYWDAPGPYAPFYDNVAGNKLLPTFYGNQPVPVTSHRDVGGTVTSPLLLTDYEPAGVLADESQATVAASGVLRGGDTSCLLGFRNHVGTADLTVCKNTSDQLVLNGFLLAPADYPVFGASGSSHAQGAVPDPGSTAGSTRYLREDGSWNTPEGSGTATSVTGGIGATTSSPNPITGSGTINVNCDPLNMTVLCMDEDFAGPSRGAATFVGKYGWQMMNGGSVAINAATGGWGYAGGATVTSPRTSGTATWLQSLVIQRAYGNNVNWDSHFSFFSGGTYGTAYAYRVGYVPASTTTNIPAAGFYMRYDPSLGSPDSTLHVCNCASSAETCVDTGIGPAQNTNYDVRVRAVASGEIGITVGTASEVTVCASGCTIAATPNTGLLTPSFEVMSNTASTAEALYANFWRFEAWGLSR